MNSDRSSEAGQALVLNVFALVVLMSFAMLVMDGGSFLVSKRNAQGVADAAALAGVRSFPFESGSVAEGMARHYVSSENADVGASVTSILATTTGGVCTIDGTTMTLPPMSVCVTVGLHQDGVFKGFSGSSQADIVASAIASASQVQAVSGWLPYGIRPSALEYDPPTEVAIRPRDGSYNDGGVINVPHGDSCSTTGNSVAEVTPGEERGGSDACPIEIGQEIRTQTGVQVGQVRSGFNDRLEGNMDTFDDVFGQTADGSYYVKLPDSPRLGLMPIADASGEWPLQGNASMTVRGYVLAYIGRTSSPDSKSYCADGCPAYDGNGAELEVYLTPVDAPLPERFKAVLDGYDPDNPSPIVYRMTS